MPSGKTTIDLTGATFDIRLKFGFDNDKEILTVIFQKIDIDIGHLKVILLNLNIRSKHPDHGLIG